ncbi:MAG TPA: rod shape-determining protein MreC [Thiothrix sp.]|nr:rod shape-determining protein MreC [Thiothrix sp.]
MLLSNPTQNNTLKFLVFAALAIFLITQDFKKQVPIINTALAIITYPIKYMVDLPFTMTHMGQEFFMEHQQLSKKNEELEKIIAIYAARDQNYRSISAQNKRLQKLLNISNIKQNRYTTSNILTIETNRAKQVVTIDKGSDDQLFDGQVALAGNGIYGQIINTSAKQSIVVQLSDTNHTIPVYNQRTGDSALAVGTGQTNEVELTNTDHRRVHINDLYLSSADGEIFPRDFLVAKVKEKRYDEDINSQIPIILATTATDYNRARELLLIWQVKNSEITTTE